MRTWSKAGRDDGTIHAIGNGKWIIYAQGPEIYNMYGPEYSSPGYGTLKVDTDIVCLTSETQRIPQTNTWVHELHANGRKNVFKDAIDPEINLFRRSIHAEFPCILTLDPIDGVTVLADTRFDTASGEISGAMHIIPEGTPAFVTDVLQQEIRMFITVEGCARISVDGRTVQVAPGESALTLIAAKTPELESQIALAMGIGDVYARDAAHWTKFLENGARIRALVPEDHPEAARLNWVLESTAIQFKAQQSHTGGVMAGMYYPMAYVRDQAGGMRGMLRMGYVDEARDILTFWYEKWKRFGNLYNAEAMGSDNARLMFTNDEVEIPAYVAFCACEYLDATGDIGYVRSIFDMVKWAIKVQLKHLAHGMTGFSGDETYIAGHVFPRPFIYHGSAESTLLFIESGRRALAFAEQYALMQANEIDMCRKAVEEAAALYRENFMIDGVLYGNNPLREKLAPPPRFHFGWCQADELLGRPSHLTWLERGKHGIYRCPQCLDADAALSCPADKRFLLGSVNLLPPYYHTTLFSRDELAANVNPYAEAFARTGYVTSDIDSDRSLGYDFGLFLYNAVYLDLPDKERALKLTLDMADPAGMWAEYYKDGVPYGCRCRPWESAINMEAIVYYLENAEGKNEQP